MISLLNNSEVMELFRNGLTDDIPNFSDLNCKKNLIKFKPNSIAELCAIYSLNRNEIEQNLAKFYNNKLSETNIKYVHPALEQHLRETFGIIIYTEQVEHILQDLANISKTESYKIRKEFGKRNVTALEDYFIEFENGCIKNQDFLKHCEILHKDFRESISEIWDLLQDNITETISFAYVLKCVSESYFQALEITRK
jgi:DNA polymerase-3 subunit alpha